MKERRLLLDATVVKYMLRYVMAISAVVINVAAVTLVALRQYIDANTFLAVFGLFSVLVLFSFL